ncbi:hypothetical protein PR202_gb18529 [Eleusine coracana subsp. coracana]|uniref:Uncharacterized protein n=1 Tax=Eleusine coracana subsp. coracana TaxID=191504 RepID=A0AAV5F3H8_ELECO|nr:hypothetical protein PR202_gb18529 [Eleusine coracana subsp. coracana]
MDRRILKSASFNGTSRNPPPPSPSAGSRPPALAGSKDDTAATERKALLRHPSGGMARKGRKGPSNRRVQWKDRHGKKLTEVLEFQPRSLKDGVVDVRRHGDRIILVRLIVGDSALNVISAYAPQVASEVFGVSRGGKQEAKDTWWWNDKVQRAIKEKKECFKRLHLDKSATNIEGYKIAKRAAKRAVSVAKGQAYDNLYQRLGTKEGEKDIYRMARIRERKTRDINQIKCIKDGVDRLLVRDEEIKDRWREYFDKLFNGEEEGPILELDDSFDDNNRRFVRRIQETEIEEALKRMKSGKAMGPDGIPIEDYTKDQH